MIRRASQNHFRDSGKGFQIAIHKRTNFLKI
jgi:hypothetical protein